MSTAAITKCFKAARAAAGCTISVFSVNNITLMALTLSVGFVVDDAIVMLENIMRHVENGEPVFRAALTGCITRRRSFDC